MTKLPTNSLSTDEVDDDLLPLTEAKRRSAFAFEARYLIRVMTACKGSVSAAARLAQLDRTNFRRLLHRHGIDPVGFKKAAQEALEKASRAEPTLETTRMVGRDGRSLKHARASS